jgi:hypothetical protein
MSVNIANNLYEFVTPSPPDKMKTARLNHASYNN